MSRTGRATRAFRGGRKPPIHAPGGTIEGGQFIGRASVLHAIIRALQAGGKPGKRPAVEAHLRGVGRRRLLATAREHGVSPRRGKPDADVIAAITRPRSRPAPSSRGGVAEWEASNARRMADMMQAHRDQQRRPSVAPARSRSRRAQPPSASRPRPLSSIRDGDVVVWESQQEPRVSARGVFRDPGPRRQFIDWEDGRRERVGRRSLGGREGIRFATPEEMAEPVRPPRHGAGAPDLEQRARDRQAHIDRARGFGEMGAELDELIDNEASSRALSHRMHAAATRHGIADEMFGVLGAIEVNDREGARRQLRDVMRQQGVELSDQGAGAVVPLDRQRHHSLAGRGLPGDVSVVHVVRPGYTIRLPEHLAGDSDARVLTVHARVEPATAEEIRGLQQAQRGATTPRRRSARERMSGTRTTAQHVAVLEALASREEATEYLQGVRGQALTDLARHYHADYRRTVAERRSAIVQATVGVRLDRDAIRRVSTTPGVLPAAPEPRVISTRELAEVAMRLRTAHDMEHDEAITEARQLLADRNPGATFELDSADDGLDTLDTHSLIDLAAEYEISNPRDLSHRDLLTLLRARNATAPRHGQTPAPAAPSPPAAPPPIGAPPPDRITGRRPSAGLRISLALQKWSNGDGPDEPLVGKFTREQMRREALARGLTVPRRATEQQIADLLKDETRQQFRQRERGRSDLRSVADLMDPMQRTTDDDVRAVFEGEYSGMTVRIPSDRFGGIGIFRGPNNMQVAGTIYDSSGRQVGRFVRRYDRNRQGQLVAHHELLSITSQVQGSGFSNAWNGHLIRWYRASGVKEVRVHADIDVGGYAWARLGYDFASQRSADHILDLLQREVLRLERTRRRSDRGGDWQEEIRQARELLLRAGDRRFGEPGFPTPYEISQLGRWDGAGRMDRWIGKRILLGSDWYGVLRL